MLSTDIISTPTYDIHILNRDTYCSVLSLSRGGTSITAPCSFRGVHACSEGHCTFQEVRLLEPAHACAMSSIMSSEGLIKPHGARNRVVNRVQSTGYKERSAPRQVAPVSCGVHLRLHFGLSRHRGRIWSGLLALLGGRVEGGDTVPLAAEGPVVVVVDGS